MSASVIDLTDQTFGLLVVLTRGENNKRGNAQWICRCACGALKMVRGDKLRGGRTKSCGRGKKSVDLTGRTFGRWVVLARRENNSDNKPRYACRCACGIEKMVDAKELREGTSKSCGCLKRDVVDLVGQTFGRLTVIGRADGGNRRPRWTCRCECGAEKEISGSSLRLGAKSCGCLHAERATTHGLSRTPEYQVWAGMMQRCYNPRHKSYSRYGGRGITVDPLFHKPENFIAYMGPRPTKAHTVDRIKNGQGYKPGNVKWGTHRQQVRNKCTTRWVLFNGRRMIIADVAALLGLGYNTLYQRLDLGWPEERWGEPVRKRS